MRKFILTTGAALLFVGQSYAADIPSRQPQPVRAAPPQVFTWNGCYVGANGGYGWGGVSATALGTTVELEQLKGPLAGGQFGCNMQSGTFVYGIEADAQWSDIRNSYNVFGIAFTDRISWFGTLRGRLGIAADRVLFYATGGGSYGQFRSDASFGGVTVTASENRGGWTVGGGIEFAFANNWSVKGEYLYLQSFDDRETLFAIPIDTRVHAHIARVGLNYRFGGGN